MGGHCFLDRCNHLRQSDKEEVSVLIAGRAGRGEKGPASSSLSSRVGALLAGCAPCSLSREAVISSPSDGFESLNNVETFPEERDISRCVQNVFFLNVCTKGVHLFHGGSNIDL